jgi:hypothetical protein
MRPWTTPGLASRLIDLPQPLEPRCRVDRAASPLANQLTRFLYIRGAVELSDAIANVSSIVPNTRIRNSRSVCRQTRDRSVPIVLGGSVWAGTMSFMVLPALSSDRLRAFPCYGSISMGSVGFRVKVAPENIRSFSRGGHHEIRTKEWDSRD